MIPAARQSGPAALNALSRKELRTVLEKAITHAVKAHAGQRDRNGEPYILHPLRVMIAGANYAEQIVGVLHDVIEDCGGWAGNAEIGEWLPGDLLDALDAITHKKGPGWKEPHGVYIRRLGRNAIARAVKLNDLHDNMAPWRSATLSVKLKRRFGRRYPACLKYLRSLG